MNILCYADDVVLLAPSSEGFQIMIDNIYSMLRDLNLLVNMEKTICLVSGDKSVLLLNIL